jgi:hypothetical protein
MPQGSAKWSLVAYPKAFIAAATSCEHAHNQAKPIFAAYKIEGDDKYYRFNVSTPAADIKPGIPDFAPIIDLAEYKKMAEFAQLTAKYLQQAHIAESVEKCAKKLVQVK